MTGFAGRHRTDTKPFYTTERCHIAEYINTDLSPESSLAQCRVAVGITTQLHSLKITERYFVQEREGLMELNQSERFMIKPGDTVIIPPNYPQRVRNIGSEELVFLCLCTPRFEPEHYVNLEDAHTPSLDI